MFEMNLPWWELVVRGTVVYLVLLLLVRLSGKRTVGQFTPFDLLVVMLLSEAVSGSLSGSDESLQGGLLVAAIVVALNGGVGFLSSRSKAVERAVDGEPVLIGLWPFLRQVSETSPPQPGRLGKRSAPTQLQTGRHEAGNAGS
jgi:hypothetical protein